MTERSLDIPLYDPRFEHDACGVGFVADAGGRNRARVLPLALTGLASLGHRGAFAADGESSDGAGVALPLERPLAQYLAPGMPPGTAVVMLFLPPGPTGTSAARRVVEEALAVQGLSVARWREVPTEPAVVGAEARSTIPAIAQVLVPRPPATTARAFERRLLLARRRMESAARAAELADFAVASASARSVVYKGLVTGSRLSDFYPDLARPLPLSYAVFHQRYATNTTPRWALAQPFRLIAHNGEINTVRGNREQFRGRSRSLGGRLGHELLAAGPLLAADGSDSLSLDEALELLVAGGRPLEETVLELMPESLAVRGSPHPRVQDFQRTLGGRAAPWDGPAAVVFADGRRVGAILDRNGLRPAAVAITHDRLVAVASEAGAVPIPAAETGERGRLGPGEMLLVDPRRGQVWHDAEAKSESLRRLPSAAVDRPAFLDVPPPRSNDAAPSVTRWVAGLDAERLRLSIRTMALEGVEPLWSMGDDTPTAALARLDRPVTDHLRQSFAQVTNPPIDPERERVVMDLGVDLGRRPPLLGALPGRPATLRLARPFVADVPGLLRTFKRARSGGLTSDRPRSRALVLDATWSAAAGPGGLDAALDRLVADAVTAAHGPTELLIISDRSLGADRLPVPSVLATGAVHTALTAEGVRGRADLLVEAADVLDVHAAAMVLASGATAVSPWLALELAAEQAGSRGAEAVTAEAACQNFLAALDKGLRKVLARMGISTAASYIGGQFFEVLELDSALAGRCFPAAPIWPGSVGLPAIAERQLRRLLQAGTLPKGDRLPDPGFVRYRSDGEIHLYAPPIVRAMQALAQDGRGSGSAEAGGDPLDGYREILERPPAVVRDQLFLRRATVPLVLDEVETAAQIVRRFVGAAMSLGALGPEAHQTLTIGLQRAGAAANTGEGGEDPAWYDDSGGERRDAAIKQVASARFGVTATYLSRAEQLEIKIAQGSKPGEGGQLPGKKATPQIAALRRGQPGQWMISPPPHHDIYSIEDLAQLIADLRAINPDARIGVKLVAAIGIGTIAAGVAKAGADYIQVSGHSGGTGASPLSSIKHAGIPWELGLAEVQQVLIRNHLRDRVALRVDGGLQRGRDVVIAALLGAEEFGFGTAGLVALGCDMARQCHLDTCPTGIATQREDLRGKFNGKPEDVVRFFHAIAEDVRRELAAIGLPSIAEAIGRPEYLGEAEGPRTLDLSRLLTGPAWQPRATRRANPRHSRLEVAREAASALEARLVNELAASPTHPNGEEAAAVPGISLSAALTTADRSFGAQLSGELERGRVRGPLELTLRGAAGQSFGAFVGRGMRLVLEGQANDYVGKGLSGGTVILRPERELRDLAGSLAICGNTCLYGATGGTLHVVGQAGMRFAVRNSGARAVVEGIGPHGCEYMTGGTVVVLGPAGPNMAAGMTGGRLFLHDPERHWPATIDPESLSATRLASVPPSDHRQSLLEELLELLKDHAAAGSAAAARILDDAEAIADAFWVIEPRATAATAAPEPSAGHVEPAAFPGSAVAEAQPPPPPA